MRFFSARFCEVLCKKKNLCYLFEKKKFQHLNSGPFLPDLPFTPMWGQEPAPQMVPYPDLMGFPCTDLGEMKYGLKFKMENIEMQAPSVKYLQILNKDDKFSRKQILAKFLC